MLEIDSGLVGTELSGIEREVSRRDTTNYAAALKDLNPLYFDDTSDGGIVAPPMLAVAITWAIVGNIQKQLEGSLPMEIVPTMVHGSEHLIFHRLIMPGDKLRIGGIVAAISPTRAGAHLVIRLDATDESAEPVFTEYNGAIFRGVKCADAGRGKNNLPEPPKWDEPSNMIWDVEIPIPREMSYIYDGCTDIVFPIHTSPAFARNVGLPGIILQGTATLALAAREIVNREAQEQPERLREIACRFSNMVIPGSKIKVELTRKDEKASDTLLGFRVLNEQGAEAVRFGYAKLSR